MFKDKKKEQGERSKLRCSFFTFKQIKKKEGEKETKTKKKFKFYFLF